MRLADLIHGAEAWMVTTSEKPPPSSARPAPREQARPRAKCVRPFPSLSLSNLRCAHIAAVVAAAITAQPLNLANSPALHLLTPEEQTLCSQLRILPKPYLVIKETLVREYARRGGKLRRREARDLVKIDVNKTSRVWDFLVQAGFLKVGSMDVPAAAAAAAAGTGTGAAAAAAPGPGQGDVRSVHLAN